jgi:TRAP-type mannitol/chloroaromatic compound transport system substrate-binding protein
MIAKLVKVTAVAAVTLIMLLTVLACAPSGSKSEEAATGKATQEAITWRMTTHYGKGTGEHRFTAEDEKGLVAMINKASGGRLVIETFALGEVVPVLETFEAVRTGTLDAALTAPAYWAGKIPAASFVYCLPFGIHQIGHDVTFLKDLGAEEILRNEYAKFNIHLVGLQPVGPTYVMSNKRIVTADDWKGTKVRTIGLMADVLDAAGASVAPIPTQELYVALETGVVEAATWANVKMEHDLGLHEVTKYLLLPPLSGITSTDFYVNMDRWNELPDDLKAIVVAAEQAYAFNMGRYETYESDRIARELFDQGILEPAVMPESEVAKLAEISEQTLQALAEKDAVSKEIFTIYDNYLKLLGIVE